MQSTQFPYHANKTQLQHDGFQEWGRNAKKVWQFWSGQAKIPTLLSNLSKENMEEQHGSNVPFYRRGQ
jgi:hypothetical protein